MYSPFFIFSFCSSVSKLTGYELENWDSILSRSRDFALRQHIQTSPGMYPASCLVGNRKFVPG